MKKYLLIAGAVTFFLFPTVSFAAVALNNTNTMLNATVSPATGSFSVTAGGSNVVAFACIAYDRASGMSIDANGVTYGGQTMQSAGAAAHNTTDNDYAEVYYLVNPPTGSNTLSVTVNGTITDIYYNLISFSGVNQTTPIRAGTYQTNVSDTSSVSLTITSNASDLTMSCANLGGFGGNTNQTSDGRNFSGTLSGGSDHATTAASSVTHTWSVGSNNSWAMAGFSIQTAAGGGGGAASAKPGIIIRGGGKAPNYTYSRSVTINASQVPSTQTSFPVLVCANGASPCNTSVSGLNQTGAGAHVLNTVSFNGTTVAADMIFTSDSACTALLSWDFDNYVASTGEMEVWVNISSLASGSVFYMCYGNSAITTYQGGSVGAAWNSNYVAVYHLNSNANDSTANALNGTITGTTNVAGKIGNAINFNSTSDKISLGVNKIEAKMTNNKGLTFAAWFNPSTAVAVNSMIVGWDDETNGAFRFNLDLTGANYTLRQQARSTSTDASQAQLSTAIIATSTWTMGESEVDVPAKTINLFVSGAASGGGAVTFGTSTFQTDTPTTLDAQIGNDPANTARRFIGTIDELRVMKATSTADWITTEYNNQSAPATFETIGTEATPAAKPSPAVKIRGGSKKSAAWTIVNSTPSAANITTGQSITIPSTTAHNAIIITTRTQLSSVLTSITDNASSNGYASAGVVGSRSTSRTEIWYACDVKGGATAVTFNFGGGGNTQPSIWEVSGLAKANCLDNALEVSEGDQGASATPTSPLITTATAGEFLVSFLNPANNATGMHAGNEFTSDSIFGGNGVAHITSNSASAGTHQAQWDVDVSGVYDSVIAAFKLAAAIPAVRFR